MTYLVWLFLFITVYWWGGNSGVIEFSGGEIPSKLRVAMAAYSVFTEEELIFFILCENLFLFLSMFLFVLQYLVTYKKEPFYQKFFSLYSSLPIMNKIALFTFSLTFAIPVRIWINFNLPRILMVIYYFVVLYLATIFLYVTILVFFQIILLFSSLIFTFFYLRSEFIRTQTCKRLFDGNEGFAKLYFDFFWGNMDSNSRRRAIELVSGGVFTYLAREARERATEKAEEKGKERCATAIEQSTEPVTHNDAYELRKKAVKEARAEDPLLNVEDSAKETAKSVGKAISDWWNGL